MPRRLVFPRVTAGRTRWYAPPPPQAHTKQWGGRNAVRLGSLAKKAASASTIKDVRAAFKNLSNIVIETQSLPEGFAVAYCPMVFDGNGAQWIQRREPELINPYAGASMLNCGVFKE